MVVPDADVRRRLPFLLALAFVLGAAFGVALAALASAIPKPEPDIREASEDEVFGREFIAGCLVPPNKLRLLSQGAVAMFDGRVWHLIRVPEGLRAIACGPRMVIAAGDAGRVVRFDPPDPRPAIETVTDVDLHVALFVDDEVYVAGAEQVVLAFADRRWQRLRRREGEETWLVATALGRREIWFGGSRGRLMRYDGVSFREQPVQEEPPFDVTALAPYGDDVAVAAGRIYWISRSGEIGLVWKAGTPIRALFSPDGVAVYFATEDDLAVVHGARVRNQRASRVLTGLACQPRAIFGTGPNDIWVLAADPARSGLAHFDGARWVERGRC